MVSFWNVEQRVGDAGEFTTLFGLLAVEMAVGLVVRVQQYLAWFLAAIFLMLNLFFIYRSFYWMRIEDDERIPAQPVPVSYAALAQES